jgi:hypothetical protein
MSEKKPKRKKTMVKRSIAHGALALGIALAILAPAAAPSGNVTINAGFTSISIDFGGLKNVGKSVQPTQKHIRADQIEKVSGQPVISIPAQKPNEQSPEALRGRALLDQGMKAFSEKRWADASELLRQASALLRDNPAIQLTLANAQIGLRYEESVRQADERAAKRIAEDKVQTTGNLDHLLQAMDNLRQEASQSLINNGQFEAAVRLPSHADFIIDSSVVDLRQARSGVVNFDVLKPPVSRTGDVGFNPPPVKVEPPGVQTARKCFLDIAMEKALFEAQISEALGYAQSVEERQNRYSDPVMRAVADRLGIDLGNATREQRDSVRQKTEKIWNAYDAHNRLRFSETGEVVNRSMQTFGAMIERLKSQGIIKPGENYLVKEKNDPVFKELLRAEVKAIVLEEESARRQANRAAFDRMLADVGAILERKGK